MIQYIHVSLLSSLDFSFPPLLGSGGSIVFQAAASYNSQIAMWDSAPPSPYMYVGRLEKGAYISACAISSPFLVANTGSGCAVKKQM